MTNASPQSQLDYTFSKTADYSLSKVDRTDLTGRCYEPYIPSDRLVEAVQLAIDLQRPLLLEGEPGCGKTRLATALVYQLTQNNRQLDEAGKPLWWPYYVWTVKSYTRARDGLYTFDAIGRLRDAQMANLILQEQSGAEPGSESRERRLERLQNPKSYRTFGALGQAIQEMGARAVVLIDEVDKADSDFANDLLLELDEFRFEVAETGEKISAPTEPPIIILTSNRERPLPDAFLRRCLYFNINFPTGEELKAIARQRLLALREDEHKLVDAAIEVFEEIRADMNQPGSRSPGTSEFLEFVSALRRKSVQAGEQTAEQMIEDLPNQLPLLGILLKTKTDQELYVKKAQVRKPKRGEKE